MKLALSFLALAAMAWARTELMVPLHAYPGGTTMSVQWAAVVDAAHSHPDMHFYVVINPNSGPKNTSGPGAGDISNCSPTGVDYIPHGCDKDWSTNVGRLNQVSNIQTLGYVYARYGHTDRRSVEKIEEDIKEWADWDLEAGWGSSQPSNISIHGIWFDETGVDKGNETEFRQLTDYARQVFNAKTDRGQFDIVMNPGSNPAADYEQALFDMADAVVTRETCWTTTVGDECPTPYTAYNWTGITCGDGAPFSQALNSKAVVVVHEFHDPPEATNATLLEQIRGTVRQGFHSAYFTSGSYANTTIEPASIGNVAEFFSLANNETSVPMPNPCTANMRVVGRLAHHQGLS
ncbi:Spherulation-specific family 4 [Apiospora phragmitis]|uniref:Spherulation-specific family 4 n=1 Tax=Apiospora phragmitis TaxID=2905665 RepID=A0ABR1SVD2_9PEZI